jgi:hypothetical protein
MMPNETGIRTGLEKAIVALGRRLARRSAVQDAPAVLAALAPCLRDYIAAYKEKDLFPVLSAAAR